MCRVFGQALLVVIGVDWAARESDNGICENAADEDANEHAMRDKRCAGYAQAYWQGVNGGASSAACEQAQRGVRCC